MSDTSLLTGTLVLTLAAAVVADVRRQTIPNRLTVPAMALGLLLNGMSAGGHGLLSSLAGVGVAGLALLPYAFRAGLGAGDVKLLGAVGALTGPAFTLRTLLCAAVAGALLGLAYALRRGALRHAVGHALRGGHLLLTLRSPDALAGLAAHSQAGKMPYAPAIALGAAVAAWLRHAGVGP